MFYQPRPSTDFFSTLLEEYTVQRKVVKTDADECKRRASILVREAWSRRRDRRPSFVLATVNVRVGLYERPSSLRSKRADLVRLVVVHHFLHGGRVRAQERWAMASTWSSWAPLGNAAHSSMKS